MISATTYYVHKDLASCSDSYSTAQAQNYGTPWCNMSVAFTNMVGGDTICIGSGYYNEELYYQYKTISSNITLTACNGSNAWLTSYIEDYYHPNSEWTNLSDSQYTIYQTTFGVTTDATTVYDGDGEKFITDKWMSWFTGRNFNRSLSDATNNTLLLRSTNPTFNPNKGNIYIADTYQTIYLAHNRGPGYFIISGLKFKFHRRAINIVNMSNIVIDNITSYGGFSSLRVEGKKYGENITIKNSFFNGNWSKDWYQDITKFTYEETTGVATSSMNRSVFIHNNIFENWGGAITLSTTTPYDTFGSRVYNNLFYGGSQSQIEIEIYCANSTWYNNTIINSQMGVSLGPATSPPEYPCRFHHNTIHLPGNIYHDESGGVASYPLKTYRWDHYPDLGTEQNGTNVTNWEIDHNIFYGKGNAYYGILADILENHYRERSAHNLSFEYNVFYSDTLNAVYGAGQASQGVFYDNNLYSTVNDYPVFTRWNNDSDGTSFQSLYEALNSSNYDGTWDKHSKESKPFFYNVTAHDYRPINSSYACVIGAGSKPCITNELLTCNVWTLNKNKIIDTNHDCKITVAKNSGTGSLTLINGGELAIATTVKAKGVRLNGGSIRLSGSIRLNG